MVKYMLALFAAICVLSSAAAISPHNSKRDVSAIIKEVAAWYHQKYGADYETAAQFMIEIGNQESWLGTHPNTYRPGGGTGWAQFDPGPLAGFKFVQDKLKEKRNQKRAEDIKERWGFDPRSIDISYLDESDVASAVFLREFLLKRDPSPIPKTLEGRAAWWKKYYNTARGKGTESAYIKTNTYRDRNGIVWVYSGSDSRGERYFKKLDESRVGYIKNGIFNGYACAAIPDGPAASCIRVSYCDDYYSKKMAEDAISYLESLESFVSGGISLAIVKQGSPQIATGSENNGESKNIIYMNARVDEIRESSCRAVASVSYSYPGCEREAKCGNGSACLCEGLDAGGAVAAGLVGPNGLIALVSSGGLQEGESGAIVTRQDGLLLWGGGEIVAESSNFLRWTVSTYMAREGGNFNLSGEAYQILPSGLMLEKALNITLKRKSGEFEKGDGILVYRFNDSYINRACNISIIESLDNNGSILIDGGVMELGDMRIMFPRGASDGMGELSVRRLMLSCGANSSEAENDSVAGAGNSGTAGKHSNSEKDAYESGENYESGAKQEENTSNSIKHIGDYLSIAIIALIILITALLMRSRIAQNR